MTNQNKNTDNHTEEDEIDLIALAKTLWEGRKTVIKTTLIFMGIGLFVAVFSPKEYTASTTFVPQTSEGMKIGGNLGGLAAMAGINLGGMNSDSGIPPDLYPLIIQSIPFQKELLETPLTIEGQDHKITFKDYYANVKKPGILGYLKKYTIGLPGVIIKAIKGKSENVILSDVEGTQLLSITNEENELIKQLNNQISLNVNDKEGYVNLSANMPEALASAELTLKAQQLLQRYVIDFKIQKSKEQLEFIKKRYFEIEDKFKEVQQKLAKYIDRNQQITKAQAKAKLEILQDEYELMYGVYKELAKQLEAQYIQVTEDTPVFTVLNPVTVPLERSKPERPKIFLIWTFLGVFSGLFIVLKRNIFSFVRVAVLKIK